MKLLRISIIRAIAAVVVGVLLLKYDAAVLKGLTIVVGVMFLIAGVVSLVGWVNGRRRKPALRAYDNGDGSSAANDGGQPMFPIAGLGSLLLGLILSLTRSDDYLEWALYLLGSVLVLGALNQLMNLMAARKMEPIGGWMWLLPCAVVVASVFAMCKGLVPATTCTTVLGVTALFYAVAEVLLSFLLGNINKRYQKTQAQVNRAAGGSAPAATDAVVVSQE